MLGNLQVTGMTRTALIALLLSSVTPYMAAGQAADGHEILASQLDGLGHLGEAGLYYNCNDEKDFAGITGLKKLGKPTEYGPNTVSDKWIKALRFWLVRFDDRFTER